MSNGMQVTGAAPLLSKFTDLPEKLQKKYGRRGVAKAARVLVKAAKALAPVRSGLLKKSLGFRPRTYKHTVLAVIGPRKETKASAAKRIKAGKALRYRGVVGGKIHIPAKIAHLVEGGHGGPHPAPPHPFVKPAMDANMAAMNTIIAAELRAGLVQESGKT